MRDNNNDERREYRRNRRVRNQILAYLLLIVLVGLVTVPLYMGAKALVHEIASNNKVPEISEVSDDDADSVSDDLPDTISSPDAALSVSEDIPEKEEETTAPVDEDIRAAIDSMSTEQKTAALFMVSPETMTGVDIASRAGDGTKAAIEKYAVGAIVYDKKNVLDEAQFKDMVEKTGEMYAEAYVSGNDLRYLIKAVKEDGTYTALASASGKTAPQSGSALASSGDSSAAYQAFLDTGSLLNEYKIDLDLAPVCDLASSESSYVKDEAFGSDPDTASLLASSAVSALSDQKIMSCASTYPGQGELTAAPAGATESAKSFDDLKEAEMKPFASCIEKGVPFVMVGSLTVSGNDEGNVPAYISEKMISYLKNDMGFEGVVITDDLSVISQGAEFDQGEAALRAINAGADMIYVSAGFEDTYNAVLKAVKDGAITEERLDDALVRQYKIKKEFK
jgi:beta-N-acetylhexosaminidase